MRRALTALLFAWLAAGLVPVSALAATATVTPGGELTFTAGAGEANAVTVQREADGSFTITDSGVASVTPALPCTTGGAANQVSCPGAGVDRIVVTLGDQADAGTVLPPLPALLVGGDGGDTLTGGAGADALDGGGAADTLIANAGGDFLDGGDGDDALSGGDGEDYLAGGTGSESAMSAGAGDDILAGGAGGETLAGGAGHDLLDGGTGADGLVGGDGFDTADYSQRQLGVSVDLDGSADDGNADDASSDDVEADIEAVRGGAGGDVLTGSAALNQLSGGAGGDTLSGGAGNDIIEGGDGDDTMSGGDGDDDLRDVSPFFGSSTNVDQLLGGPGNDELVGGSDVDTLEGGDGIDTLNGGAGNDGLDGEAGNDFLVGGSDADTIAGGDGLDGASYLDHTANVLADLDGAPGDDGETGEGDTLAVDVENLTGGRGDDTLEGSGLANRLDGAGGADVLRGLGDADVLDAGTSVGFTPPGLEELDGGEGDDTLIGRTGPDQLTGGGGRDRADYSDHLDFNAGGVTVDLDGESGDDGNAEDGPVGARDTLAGIEDVGGTLNDDTLVGDPGPNFLDGGAGADSLTGGAGADLLEGGFDDDAIAARDGVGDRVACAEGVDSVVSEAADNVAPDCESVDRGIAALRIPSVADSVAPRVGLRAGRQRLRSVVSRGLRVRASCSEPCALALELRLPGHGVLVRRALRRGGRVRLRLPPVAVRRLLVARPRVLALGARGIDPSGNVTTVRLRVVILR
jgi:Ca2+-binding RTX toxin-like protein